MYSTVKRSFKLRTRDEVRMKLYKRMTGLVLLYGSETWTVKKEDTTKRNEVFKVGQGMYNNG
jgi:hypothetical protein